MKSFFPERNLKWEWFEDVLKNSETVILIILIMTGGLILLMLPMKSMLRFRLR
ncbi:MAG: DUF751 domain-containing protein [Clostridia bacterium]|nr:DUF751 domain-containing protein [Clostridia bacterium]